MDFRVAGVGDVDAVTDTIRLAFMADPIWGPALSRPDGSTEHLQAFWRLYVEGGLRFSTVFMLDDASAVAVWIPPGESELSEQQESDLHRLIRDNFSADFAEKEFELYDRIESAHPRDVPHAYLSIIATHPGHRGQGIGQRLLAANLAYWDARGVPSYLESTNPDNLHRYERAGYRAIGTIDAVLDDAVISTMWRARPASA
jgi:GNAT superfamily N-acetyltransferase